MRMGFIALATAASIAAAAGITSPAMAQDRDGWHDHGRHEHRDWERHNRWERHHDHRYGNNWRGDRHWRHHRDDRYSYGYGRGYPGYYGW